MGDWKIEKGLCRCCHSEGSFQSLSELCVIGGEEGHYTDLLRLTLSISIRPVADTHLVNTFTICDDCIMRLKEATSFKQQVMRCETTFYEMHSKGVIKVEVPTLIKQEPDTYEQKIEDADSDVNNDPVAEDVDSEPDVLLNTEISCKKEPESVEMRKSGRTKKPSPLFDASKSKPKKPLKRTISKAQKQAKEAIKQAKKEAKNKKILEDRQKGSQPAFRLSDEDYWRDGATYHCARCDKQYDKFFSLKFHVKTKHYKIPRFPCPYCVAKFMTAAPLTIHKLEEHNIDERFKCNACKGTFNTKVQLRKHINNFHMLGEKHKCEFCEYESFSFEGLYKHKFKHKTVKDYHCRFCRKSFLRKTTLDLHERIHTGDRRKICSVCGQAFVQKASLNYHMAKYHPEVNY